MKWGFDLDGVLAVGPPASAKKWGYMKGHERTARLQELVVHYAQARVLFRPNAETFYVVTARKGTEQIRLVTEQWLVAAFGRRVAGLYLLAQSRSLVNVIAFKSRVIRNLGLTDFAEDNPAVVKGLRAECPRAHIWLFERGELRPDPRRKP